MVRIRILLATAAVVCLGCIGVTVASAAKVTGGTTAITASSAALNLLRTNHLLVSPLGAATVSGATYTFPIARGKLNVKTLRGYIIHKGGLKVSNSTKTVALRVPTIISNQNGISLWALVRAPVAHACRPATAHLHQGFVVIRWVARRIATITDVKVTGTSASGTVKITAFTAAALNKLAGKTVAAAGDTLGTATTSPTL